jgi:RNA polymerase sigma-70 factor (ECF subfamily)
VRRLPGDRRRAVVLRFVDEMSTAEIAGVLERSEGAVRVLLHRALRSVARDLGGSFNGDGATPRGRARPRGLAAAAPDTARDVATSRREGPSR